VGFELRDYLAFIDFETTGLSARRGDRVIEVGIAVLDGSRIVDRYQSLINPRMPIPWQIEELTGITDDMVRSAPSAREVMSEVHDFIGEMRLVAHNASFDRGFMDAEFSRIRRRRKQDFICSLRVARRVYPRAPNHKLGTLVNLTGVKAADRAHRALGDAEMTARVWSHMVKVVRDKHRIRTVPIELMESLQHVRVRDGDEAISRWCAIDRGQTPYS
jgi:DNA polymerase-3 subunit epsilon